MSPLKLLVVDDSALMRRQLQTLFQATGEFDVHLARTGVEAIAANRELQPDVITLDINMPEMDGLTALAQIMAERPVPVVMLSSLTERGALATFEALNLGAVDYLAKPGGTISLTLSAVEEELVRKVRAAARARPRRGGPAAGRAGPAGTVSSGATARAATRTTGSSSAAVSTRAPLATRTRRATDGLVLIGVSTGGPRTLEEILPLLPADFPWPICVAQHMPAAFTRPFAQRLDDLCALTVCEVDHPMPVEAGTVYIARGGADMLLSRRAGALVAAPRPEHSGYTWHPSVELLAQSALEHCPPSSLVGVMLTGMGNDGAATFTEIRQRGGRTIAESEETAVVYGMPADLVHRNGATIVLPATRIARQLDAWASR